MYLLTGYTKIFHRNMSKTLIWFGLIDMVMRVSRSVKSSLNADVFQLQQKNAKADKPSDTKFILSRYPHVFVCGTAFCWNLDMHNHNNHSHVFCRPIAFLRSLCPSSFVVFCHLIPRQYNLSSLQGPQAHLCQQGHLYHFQGLIRRHSCLRGHDLRYRMREIRFYTTVRR